MWSRSRENVGDFLVRLFASSANAEVCFGRYAAFGVVGEVVLDKLFFC
jgi:hypothetical protein